jgi:hypothetical protein
VLVVLRTPSTCGIELQLPHDLSMAWKLGVDSVLVIEVMLRQVWRWLLRLQAWVDELLAGADGGHLHLIMLPQLVWVPLAVAGMPERCRRELLSRCHGSMMMEMDSVRLLWSVLLHEVGGGGGSVAHLTHLHLVLHARCLLRRGGAVMEDGII